MTSTKRFVSVDKPCFNEQILGFLIHHAIYCLLHSVSVACHILQSSNHIFVELYLLVELNDKAGAYPAHGAAEVR